MANKLPNQSDLKHHFNYSPLSGELSWRNVLSNRVKNGTTITTRNSSKHLRVTYKGINYLVHRIIWKMVTGCDPLDEIDHINGNPMDNTWGNLREASRVQNMCNTKLYTTNTSGVAGVNYHKLSGKWRARIMIRGRDTIIGYYNSIDEAAAARKEYSIRINKQFAGEHRL